MVRGTIAVIGAGIIGLSSAVLIQECLPNLHITVIAEKFSPDTTGDGSAGSWLPNLSKDVPEDTLRKWCKKTFQFLIDIYRTPESSDCGVSLINAYDLKSAPQPKPVFSDLFIDWQRMSEKELALFNSKYPYGEKITTFYTECSKLLPYLLKRFKDKGGIVIPKKVNKISDLQGYDVVVNCTGLGAAELAPDTKVYPVRGQVFKVKAPWIKHIVIADGFYIIPNTDTVTCGGTHQKGDWNLEVDPADSHKIWEGCTQLIPSLKRATVIREWVGLRPGRCIPRIERETLRAENYTLEVVHNYGHGGSGVTLFWGCAHDALELVEEALKEKYQKDEIYK